MARCGWPIRRHSAGAVLFLVVLASAACARPAHDAGMAAPGFAPAPPGPSSGAPATLLAPGTTRVPLRPPSSAIHEAYGRIPLHFEENRGQADARVRYLARTPGGTVALAPGQVLLSVRDRVVALSFEGAAPTAGLEAIDELAGRVNYLRGRDRDAWRTDIPTAARVRSPGVYPGIDVVFYGTQRRLEYDFVVAPGADPGRIDLRVAGADSLELTAEGDLRIHAGDGVIVQHPPVVYQERDGRREPIEGAYVRRSADRVGFCVGAYDRTRPLVIDPVLTYSTYLGGSDADGGSAIAVDAAGNAYIAGYTWSTTVSPARG